MSYLDGCCSPITQEVRWHRPRAHYAPDIVSLVYGASNDLTAECACTSDDKDTGL